LIASGRVGALALVALGTLAGTGVGAQESTRLMGIESLARQALESNRELLAAREGLVVAEEQVSEAWSNVYPSLDPELAMMYERKAKLYGSAQYYASKEQWDNVIEIFDSFAEFEDTLSAAISA
jgi:outer membrane protein TolC